MLIFDHPFTRFLYLEINLCTENSQFYNKAISMLKLFTFVGMLELVLGIWQKITLKHSI